MIESLRRLSFQKKIVGQTALVTAMSLAIAGITIAFLERHHALESFEASVESQTAFAARHLAVPVRDSESAKVERVFDSFREDPRVLEARIQGLLEEVGVAYRRSGLAPDAERVVSTEALLLDGDNALGVLIVDYDSSQIHEQFRSRLVLCVAILVMALGIAVVIASELTKRIVAPIQDLARTAEEVRTDEDFSLRAEVDGDAEVRALTDAFNSLLEHIEDRDAALRKSHDELEIRVVERTRDLDIARQSAEAANRTKSEFLANMSHEIRTPMTAILGYADFLDDPESSDDERADSLDTIRRNGRMLLQIINDILDLSRIEAGKLMTERVGCSPREVLEDVRKTMQAAARNKGLALTFSYEDPFPETVHTDPVRLQQIVTNLVGNAIKFTETGYVEVTARLIDASETQQLAISVVDTGPGMTHERARKIFKPFEQGDNSMTRRFGGTGLGLSISRELAVLLGGTITVTSAPDRGSEFTVYVDALQPAEHRAARGERDAHPTTSPITRAENSLRVLVCEDGLDNQRLVTAFLSRAGHDHECVDNGRVGVEAALAAESSGEPFDIVLMDMQMPEMNGFEAAATLRDAGFRKPIIAITAHAMVGDREDCLDAGCDDYLTKPIDRDKLFATLERWTEATRSTG